MHDDDTHQNNLNEMLLIGAKDERKRKLQLKVTVMLKSDVEPYCKIGTTFIIGEGGYRPHSLPQNEFRNDSIVYIGRKNEDYFVNDIELSQKNRHISREHMKIEYIRPNYYLQCTSKTTHASFRVESIPYALRKGMIIMIGENNFLRVADIKPE